MRLTKTAKRAKAAASRKKTGIVKAVKALLKKTNPSARITGASVVKLKGGVLKITPIKANPTPSGIRAQGGWSWAVYAGKQYLGSVIAPGKASAIKKAKAKWAFATRVAKHGVQ